MFKIVFPGEALTPALNELSSIVPGTEKDVLRGYLIGSASKNLADMDLDAQMEEGARVMCLVYDLLKKKDSTLKSVTLDEISKASAEKKAAEWLRRRMNAPTAGP